MPPPIRGYMAIWYSYIIWIEIHLIINDLDMNKNGKYDKPVLRPANDYRISLARWNAQVTILLCFK